MNGKFKLEIQMGNAEMCEYEHIADALIKASNKIIMGVSGGIIKDINGNTVGRFRLIKEQKNEKMNF